MSNEQALPETVFCRREYEPVTVTQPEGGEEYLVVEESTDDFSVVGEVVLAGRYELVEMVQITTEPAVVTVQKACEEGAD